jgi:hypothetical protein
MPVPGGPKGMEQLGTRGEQALSWLGQQATDLGKRAAAGAGLGMVLGGTTDPTQLAMNAGKGALGAGLLGYAGNKLPGLAPALPGMLQRGGAAASGIAGEMVAPSTAQAQQEKAYGTAPTMAWAVQSVLAGGQTGLAPADEQRLTEAILSGDEDRVISANFTLQQKSPAYAARLQRELESLQEE